MATPVPAIGAWGYGYALSRREIGGRTYIGHTGGMVGYISGLAWDPDASVGAVVLQSGPGHGPNALARLAIRRMRAAIDGRDPDAEVPEDLAALPAGDAATVAERPRPAWRVSASVRDQVIGTYRSHDPWMPDFRVEAPRRRPAADPPGRRGRTRRGAAARADGARLVPGRERTGSGRSGCASTRSSTAGRSAHGCRAGTTTASPGCWTSPGLDNASGARPPCARHASRRRHRPARPGREQPPPRACSA